MVGLPGPPAAVVAVIGMMLFVFADGAPLSFKTKLGVAQGVSVSNSHHVGTWSACKQLVRA